MGEAQNLWSTPVVSYWYRAGIYVPVAAWGVTTKGNQIAKRYDTYPPSSPTIPCTSGFCARRVMLVVVVGRVWPRDPSPPPPPPPLVEATAVAAALDTAVAVLIGAAGSGRSARTAAGLLPLPPPRRASTAATGVAVDAGERVAVVTVLLLP